MRRKTKHIVGGILIIGGATAIVDLVLQFVEHKEKKEVFTWKSYDGWRTFRKIFLGAAVGAGLGYGFYSYKIEKEMSVSFNSDEYLNEVLAYERLNSDPDFLKAVMEQRERLKEWLLQTFAPLLAAPPENSGSFHKRTAIASNYDLDFVLPFKKNSVSTLEDMYESVYEQVQKVYGSNAVVNKKSRAIGITFDNKMGEIHFDLVPGREINNYAKDKELNLYVRPNFFWQSGSSFKTNMHVQKNLLVNNPQARDVVKLLKIYRERNKIPLPSVVIEQTVVIALEENNFGTSSSTSENLLNSMDFISRKMAQQNLFDLANTNNNFHEELNAVERSLIVDTLQADVVKIEENPAYFKEIFEH